MANSAGKPNKKGWKIQDSIRPQRFRRGEALAPIILPLLTGVLDIYTRVVGSLSVPGRIEVGAVVDAVAFVELVEAPASPPAPVLVFVS